MKKVLLPILWLVALQAPAFAGNQAEVVELTQKAQDAVSDQDFKTAEGHWRALVAIEPSSLAYQNNLAVSLMKQGKLQQAAKVLNRALDADEAVKLARKNLKSIYAYHSRQAYSEVFEEIKSTQPQGQWILIESASNTEKQAASQAVESTFKLWQKAWQNQQYDAYVGFYHKDFKGNYDYRKTWLNKRKKSLSKPKWIKLTNTQIVFKPLSSALVKATYVQTYQSDRYKDKVTKTLLWEKTDHGWKITSELSTPLIAS